MRGRRSKDLLLLYWSGLEEVISRISEKMIEYEDTTKIAREMREKKYD